MSLGTQSYLYIKKQNIKQKTYQTPVLPKQKSQRNCLWQETSIPVSDRLNVMMGIYLSHANGEDPDCLLEKMRHHYC